LSRVLNVEQGMERRESARVREQIIFVLSVCSYGAATQTKYLFPETLPPSALRYLNVSRASVRAAELPLARAYAERP
jgi:hypothetical protein